MWPDTESMIDFRTFLIAGILFTASGLASDWPQYGNDPGGARHSPLTDVTPANVTRLRVAWTYRTGDIVDGRGARSSFQATPLLIDNTLFVATPLNRIIALDPETGAERWKFDPKIERDGNYGDGLTCRGLGSWKDPRNGRLYLYVATQDGRLISVDGKTGGAVWHASLVDKIEQKYRGEYHFTSPPAVVRDTVVVGSSINDNNRTNMPSGVVRGFDARTGAPRWAWDPIPKQKQDPAYASWEKDSALQTGAGNAWSLLSADNERDLVFVPTGSPSPDFFGGERLGDNRYANSVVALRGSTGELVWHFQTVHHDLWDYDVPAQPILLSLRKASAIVPALAQATKMGHLFLLHRETGKPLFPVEERAVPQTDVPGERTSPTQPFPTIPPPLAPSAAVKPEDAWGMVYWDKKNCRETIASARSEGIFTPPSLRGAIVVPGNIGGSNWGSLSYDPGRGIAVINQTRMPFYVRLYRREDLDKARKENPDSEFARMLGTPYIMVRRPLISMFKLPCTAPPWGELLGVQLATGKVLWREPLGTIRDLAPVPLPIKWGTPNLGGPMTTASGLTFIGATMDRYLRAFDTATGKELWKGRLPFTANATPMTYRARPGGKQFVVIAAGGHAKLPGKLGDHVIAYTLP